MKGLPKTWWDWRREDDRFVCRDDYLCPGCHALGRCSVYERAGGEIRFRCHDCGKAFLVVWDFAYMKVTGGRFL